MYKRQGLPDSYRDLSNFKRRVLRVPIDEINAVTDISIEYTPLKKGRTVIGYEFTVKEKPKPKTIGVGRDPDTIDMFVSMTDAQINMFGNQLSRLPEFSNLADGNESYDALASRIKDMLKDPEKQKIFIPHLRKLGFKTT